MKKKKDGKKIHHTDTNQKKINVPMSISYKEGLRQDILLEVMIKKSVQEKKV